MTNPIIASIIEDAKIAMAAKIAEEIRHPEKGIHAENNGKSVRVVNTNTGTDSTYDAADKALAAHQSKDESAVVDLMELADEIDLSQLAAEIDLDTVADSIDLSDLVNYIEVDAAGVADEIGAENVADEIDLSSLAEHLSTASVAEYVDVDDVAKAVMAKPYFIEMLGDYILTHYAAQADELQQAHDQVKALKELIVH